MDNPWVIFLFLSVFHVIGAAVLADTLRKLQRSLREREPMGCRLIFLMVWASMFGCIPFGVGAGLAGTAGRAPLLLTAQVLVWTSTFLVSLLAPQALRQTLQPFLHEETLLMLFGGGFLVGGLAVASLVTREEGPEGILWGGFFALVGALIFGYGLRKLLRSTR
jgi:hypothetical protein